MSPEQQRERERDAVAILRSSRTRLVILVVLLAAAAALAIFVGRPSRASIERLVAQAGLAGPIVYVVVYVGLTVLLFPGAVITAAGGVLFGTFLGTALTTVGASAGAVGAFLIARGLGRDQVERIAGRRVGKLDRWLSQRGFVAVLYVRLFPVIPFNALNYAAGVTGVRLRDYALATVIGIIPGTFAYSALGSSIDDPTSPTFLVAVGGVILLALAGPLANRWLRARGRGAPTAGGDPDEDAPAECDAEEHRADERA